jgi:dienelactone hydrolase
MVTGMKPDRSRTRRSPGVAGIALSFVLAACGSSGGGGPGGGPNGGGPDAPGSGTGTGSNGGDVAGCDGATLLANPHDPKAPGPWPVGVRTAQLGALTAEVWYPATVGSEAGHAKAIYDLRPQLPASERAKISDADNPVQTCECYRDLPLDSGHGRYPVVVFVHGTAAFRHQSLPIVAHWASRGFVVIAVDHPGLKLGDILAPFCQQSAGQQHLSADIDAELAAVGAPAGDLAFLADHVDATRLAIAGHSAGASAAAAASTKPDVRVVLSFAGNKETTASPTLASSLFMGGDIDSVVGYNQVKMAWMKSPTPRRLIDIANAEHLVFSDLCQIKNGAGQDLLQVANAKGVCGANLAGALFKCDPSFISGPDGWDVVDYASSIVLEDTLQCATGLPSLSTIQQDIPNVQTYTEAL